MTALLAERPLVDVSAAPVVPLSLGMVLQPTPEHRLPAGIPAVPVASRGCAVVSTGEQRRGPIELFSTSTNLYTSLLRCVDLPIRRAGDAVYLLPAEWTTLAPVIAKAIAVEHLNNSNWLDYHTYVSVECVLVQRGIRMPEAEMDASQTAPVTGRKVARTYMASSNGGVALSQPRVGAGEDAGLRHIAAENVMCFVDGHTVPEPGPATRTGMRTVLRVTYDLAERRDGTRNPLLGDA